jgi:hypothetical protein
MLINLLTAAPIVYRQAVNGGFGHRAAGAGQPTGSPEPAQSLEAAAQRLASRPDTVRPLLDDLVATAGVVALLPVAAAVQQVATAGDGSRVLVLDGGGRLVVWDVGERGARQVRTEIGASAVASSADGRRVAVGERHTTWARS